MDVIAHNRAAWNREAEADGPWSVPVDAAAVARAREGVLEVILTPTRSVPRHWFGELVGRDLLGLASAGGQQLPLLAAAGARVTSFDLSDAQLARDAQVAERERLALRCVQGDMSRSFPFADASFDLIFHPVSNLFVPDPTVVWKECARVLRPGGCLLAGFMNPDWFVFDHDEADRSGRVVARYPLPFREPDDLDERDRALWASEQRQVLYSHSLEAQLGGQIAAGFLLDGFYEDPWHTDASAVAAWLPSAFATRARLPG